MLGENCRERVAEKLRFVWTPNNKMTAAMKGMAELGIGPTAFEFRDIVQAFVNANVLAALLQDGIPGHDWTIGFTDRHKLHLKRVVQCGWWEKHHVRSICSVWVLLYILSSIFSYANEAL